VQSSVVEQDDGVVAAPLRCFDTDTDLDCSDSRHPISLASPSLSSHPRLSPISTMAAVAATAPPIATSADTLTSTKQDTLPVPQVHTPPTTDEGSVHKDDDAASSSSLSDLGDDIDMDININIDLDGEVDADEENRLRFEEAARAGAEAEQFSEVKPDRYENGVPIFTPTMEQFRDFQKYVTAVNPYGMQTGIVLIDPPEEW
jgi:hypothetical protein